MTTGPGPPPRADVRDVASSFGLRLRGGGPRHRGRAPGDGARLALRMPLVVLDGARGFRLPHGRAAVDLSKRAPLRRILDLLSRGRRDTPGEPVPVEEIIAAGWPGEQILAPAARNRARVALATLRKLGLRGVLLTADGGYLLDPAVALVVEAPKGR